MDRVTVLDAEGRQLSATSEDKARKMLRQGSATLVSEQPLVIQIAYAVELPPSPEPCEPEPLPGLDKRVLLHVCCGPCGTHTIQRLRESGYQVSGHWYNPNIHPFVEHEKRRETFLRYADMIELPVIEEPGYDIVDYFRAVTGHERFGERCQRCYGLRLERTARVAQERGFDALTTTLLISIHQDRDAIIRVGERLAEQYGVTFLAEDFRRGWSERGRLANQYGLYKQHYCGCLFSEWEAEQQRRERRRDEGET